MAEIFKNGWSELLNEELEKYYYKRLRGFLIQEYRTKTTYPNMYDIPNQAHGLSFQLNRV